MHLSDYAIRARKVTRLKTMKALLRCCRRQRKPFPPGNPLVWAIFDLNTFCSEMLRACAHEGSYLVHLSIDHPFKARLVASGSRLQSDSASPYTTLGVEPKPADGCAKNPFSAWSCCSCFLMLCGTCSPEDAQAWNSGPFCCLQPLPAICFQCADRLLPCQQIFSYLSEMETERWC